MAGHRWAVDGCESAVPALIMSANLVCTRRSALLVFIANFRLAPPSISSTAVISFLLVGWLAVQNAAYGYTSESPQVQQLVKKATDYLTKNATSMHGDGGDVLIGMAMYNADVDSSNLRIRNGIEAARKIARGGGGGGENSTYAPALACIFLCEVDPKAFQEEIRTLLAGILKRQYSNGCWSYANHPYDDTSQTQYGVLCLWVAHHAGFPVPVDAVERAAMWLVQARHQAGGWPYRTPATGGNKPPQGVVQHQQVSHSCTAAGLGSLYMCAHLLGFGADAGQKKADDGLPPALSRVKTEAEKARKFLQPQKVSRQSLSGAINSGNAWFGANLNFSTTWWTHYYMYGLERCMSFREVVEGDKQTEPAWYNKGVEFLQKTQAPDGSWKTKDAPTSSAAIDTAFAVLFLTRSSQKTIKKGTLDEGILIGGKGLPKNTANISMQDGKVVTPQMIQDVDDLLKMIDDVDNTEFDPRALNGLSLDDDITKRTSQLEKLREMVTAEEWEKRLTSVKLMASARDLDNVPALIYALSDPAVQVAREARDGLRFLSRKFSGFSMPVPATKQQAMAAQQKWTDWYLSIRPEGELMH